MTRKQWSLRVMAFSMMAVLVACEDDPNDTGPVEGPGGGTTAGTAAGTGAGTGGMMAGTMAMTGGTGGMGMTGGTGGTMTDAGTPDAGGSTQASPIESIAGGAFAGLEGYTDTMATGFALIVRERDGGTRLSLQASGLTASTMYPAHLHALPCSMAGGGHYKIDPAVTDTQETNEIWAPFMTDADGRGRVEVTSTHHARPDGMSVVIHDPAADNAKMLCADLVQTDGAMTTASGMFAAFAAAEAGDQTIAGTATMTRAASGTTVSLMVTGLTAGEMYATHVHAMPCSVMDADGHYKIDPAVTDTVDTNELWPMLTPDAEGAASAMLMNSHVARPDAQSVVIHHKNADPAPKVACADLLRSDSASYVTKGDAMALAAAATAGLNSLAGSATMTRTLDGKTQVHIEVSGLTASTEYAIHVHDRACAAADGGGHYKIDPAVTDAQETNEIWLTLTTDAAGMGSRDVEAAHLARAEAQSIVIHGADSMRLACIDLQP